MAKPIPAIRPLKGKDADRMIKYLREHPPDPEWMQKRLEEDRKILRGFGMKDHKGGGSMNTIEQKDDGVFEIVIKVKPGEALCLPMGTYRVLGDITVTKDRYISLGGPPKKEDDEMGKAQLCPVCKSEGKRKGQKCHGCGGKGWVVVPGGYSPPRLPPFEPIDPWKPPWSPYHPYPRYPGTGDYYRSELTRIILHNRAKEMTR